MDPAATLSWSYLLMPQACPCRRHGLAPDVSGIGGDNSRTSSPASATLHTDKTRNWLKKPRLIRGCRPRDFGRGLRGALGRRGGG